MAVGQSKAQVAGDVTGDGSVDIADVNAVINIMLGKAAYIAAADITCDGSVDIADVNGIINAMLGKGAPTPPEPSSVDAGLYMGIIGFNDALYTMDISLLNNTTQSSFTSFVNGLSNTPRGTLLYYAVDNALDALQTSPMPENLRNVALVTFTDGLDVGSPRQSGWKYNDRFEYGEAMHERIIGETVHGLPIQAFSIGVRGNDVTYEQDFSDELQTLASTDENATLAPDMDQVNAKFQEIADSLISRSVTQDLTLTTYGLDNEIKVRYTFGDETADNVENADTYIEATYLANGDRLTAVSYHGMTTASGVIIEPTAVEGGYITYDFKGICLNSGAEIVANKVQEWRWNKRYNIWQHNSEFTPNEQAHVKYAHSSALVMLALDCSYSLGATDFAKLLTAARAFIERMADANSTISPDYTIFISNLMGKTVSGGSFFDCADPRLRMDLDYQASIANMQIIGVRYSEIQPIASTFTLCELLTNYTSLDRFELVGTGFTPMGGYQINNVKCNVNTTLDMCYLTYDVVSSMGTSKVYVYPQTILSVLPGDNLKYSQTTDLYLLLNAKLGNNGIYEGNVLLTNVQIKIGDRVSPKMTIRIPYDEHVTITPNATGYSVSGSGITGLLKQGNFWLPFEQSTIDNLQIEVDVVNKRYSIFFEIMGGQFEDSGTLYL